MQQQPNKPHRWYFFLAALTALLVMVTGCSDENKITKKAEWLCQQGQLESPSHFVFDDETVLQSYLHPRDLAHLAEEDADDGDWSEFLRELEDLLLPIERASHRAMVRHTECDIQNVEIDDDRATVTLTHTIPAIDLDFDDLFDLEDVPEDQLEARFSEWYAESTADETTSHTIEFAKLDDGWRAYLGLERQEKQREVDKLREKISDVDDELEQVQKELDELEEMTQKLATFEVQRAELFQRQRRFSLPENYMEIEVENNTDHPVSRVYFDATYQSPERSIPWAADSMNYSISGGLEPGESASWSLTPNYSSDLRDVTVHDDAELHLKVYRLDGPDGEALWKVPSENRDSFYSYFDDDQGPEEKLDSLRAQRQELEEEVQQLQQVIEEMGL